MTDLSQLSDSDLIALHSGDISKVSDAGLKLLYQPPAPTDYHEPSSALKVGFKRAALGAIPALAGAVGVGAGAAAGSVVPVAGTIAGAVAGGTAASWAAQKAQDSLLASMPRLSKALGVDPETLQHEEQDHPVAAKVGEFASQLPEFGLRNPLKAIQTVKGVAGMLGNAGISAGTDLAQQAYQGQPIDWKSVGESAGAGALLGNPTRLGAKALGLGERGIPWREKPPAVTPFTTPVAEAPPVAPAAPTEAPTEAAPVTPAPSPRDLVLQHLQDNPETTKRTVMEATGLSSKDAIAGLNTLKKEGVVKADKGKWYATGEKPKAPEPENDLLSEVKPVENTNAKPDQAPVPNVVKPPEPAALPEVAKPAAPVSEPDHVALPFEPKTPEPVVLPGEEAQHGTAAEPQAESGTPVPGHVLDAVPNDNGRPEPSAELPPQQDGVQIEHPPVADIQRVGNAPPALPEPHVGAESGPAPVVPAPELPEPEANPEVQDAKITQLNKNLRKSAKLAFQKGILDRADMLEIHGELDSGNPDYKYIAELLNIASSKGEITTPKSVSKPVLPEPPTERELSPDEKAIQDYLGRQKEPVAQTAVKRRNKVDNDDISLSQGKSQTGGMLAKDVQDLVNSHTANWQNKPDITVHQSEATLPDNIKDAKITNAKGISLGDQVHLIADNLYSPQALKATLFHESLGHYGLRQVFGAARSRVMKAVYDTNTAMRAAADKWIASRNIKGDTFYSQMKPDALRAYATEEILAKASEQGPIKNPGIRAAFDKFAAMVRNVARKFGAEVKYSDNDVKHILEQAHKKVLHGEYTEQPLTQAALSKTAPVTKQAPPHISRNVAKMREDLSKKTDHLNEPTLKEKVQDTFKPGWYQSVVKTLQNYMQPLKDMQARDRQAGLENNLYDMRTASSGKINDLKQELLPHKQRLESAIANYIKKAGMSVKDGLAHLQLVSYGMHEGERRLSKWVDLVPLNNTKKIQVGKDVMTAADYRELLNRELEENKDHVSTGRAKAIGQRKEWLARNYADVDGVSGNKKKLGSIDIDSPIYNVIGAYDKNELQTLRDLAKNDPHQAELKEIFDARRDLQDKTTELDKRGKYWTQPVDNIAASYDWKNYVPFKGDPHADQKYELRGKSNSGDLTESAEKFAGRVSDSDNPLLQSVIDADRAAGRAGRDGVVEETIRLIKAGRMDGRRVGKYSFSERKDVPRDKIVGSRNIVRNMPDGGIEIWRIKDPDMATAIKGMNNDVGTFWQKINKITSGIGQFHTRYNPGFAPYNFVRHAMTSSLIYGAESGGYLNGPSQAAKFLGSVIPKIVDGGLIRAAKASRLYTTGNFAEINRLAQTDPFYKNIKEYMDNGGIIEFKRALTIEHQAKNLADQIGPSGFARSAEHVKQYFDIWNNTFELTGRAAAYGKVKEDLLAKMKADGMDIKNPAVLAGAQRQAMAYAKNLFNYEQVGKYGREAGSAFMFLRPAMSTAVRSIDALAPAFQSVEKITSQLPNYIKSNKDSLEKFRAAHLEKQKSARAMAAGMLGAGASLYGLAVLSSENDDQGRNKVLTDDMALWTRNIRLPIGFMHGIVGKENDYFQIPWGFGLGSFGALGAQLAAVAGGHTTLGEAIGNMIPAAMDSYLPIPVAKFNPADHPLAFIVDSVSPTIARPLIEYAMNVDEFGHEIYNNRMNQFGDAYTGGSHLPEIYSRATELLADSTEGSVNISPSTLHFFTNNYIDGVARIAHDTYGLGLTLTGAKDFDAKRDVPVLDSFIGKSSSVDAREFADISAQIQKKEVILKMYKDNPEMLDKYLDSHPNDQMIVSLYNQQNNGMLKSIRSQINQIEADQTLDPKEKHDLLTDLKNNRNWVMRGIIDMMDDYDVKP
jgi:hypothetical protein